VGLHFREWSHGVRLGFCGAHDLHHRDAPRDQGVGDQRPVASPGDSFGAHDCRGRLGGKFHQTIQIFAEFRGLHVVGEAPKRRVAPSAVDRILASVPEPTQSRKMAIVDAHTWEADGQAFLVELWIAPRFGNGSYVHQPSDAISPQDPEEFFDGMDRVSDSVDGQKRALILK